MIIGLIRERKNPADTRVALTPAQCQSIIKEYTEITIVVEPSPDRCYTDAEYMAAGIELKTDLSDCNILLGIKEVPVEYLMEGKTYCFFSHTKKKQPYNQQLMQALISKRIKMIDYECLTHEDEQRILGFGLYAGIVGAHNGLLTYGRKKALYDLPHAWEAGNYQQLLKAYEAIKLPNIKIAVTGSGKVAAGILDIMTRLDIESVEPEDYRDHPFSYPVYTHLRGKALYARKDNDSFGRTDFHQHPTAYYCKFLDYAAGTDILMNGIYWDEDIPRLFDTNDVKNEDWRIAVIADITCDVDGSVPLNIEATTIKNPVYGFDRTTLQKTKPYINTSEVIDIMAVGNLPNELPRDASEYFGLHFEKYILGELLSSSSSIIARATICENGSLTAYYSYLEDYAY